MRWSFLSGLLLATLVLCGTRSIFASDGKADLPPPAPPKDASDLGRGIQRTMTLLATSAPQHRNHVRILFYGQSITEQEWSKQVAEDLRKRFPYADLEIENRAIGGFAAQLLIRPAEHDLYPFYPDLLIFHVYGSNVEYEQIIRNVRSRTTAEILMQKDHVTQWPPAVIDKEKDKGMWWDDLMNNRFLPDTAKKYGCGLADVRSAWLDYLKTNRLEPKALLKDGVHLNADGNVLMSQLISRYLIYRPELAKAERNDTVRTLQVGKEVQWKEGKLSLSFEGNRVDLLPARHEGGLSDAAQVRIDGKKPSEFPECYTIPRPQPGPWSPLALVRVDHPSPLQVEEWSLKLTEVREEGKHWKYEVRGSLTGPDGNGDSEATFVSKSGRVRIEPDAFFRNPNVALPNGYEIRWHVLPMGMDVWTAPPIPDPSREYPMTLAQGLANTHHTLEISAANGKQAPIRAIRIYRPPLQ